MKRIIVGWCLMLAFTGTFAQDLSSQLLKAIQTLEKSEALKYGMAGLYVVDSKTGKELFSYNGEKGFAPASTLKVITAVSAYELLGQNYRFNTEIRYGGVIEDGILYGNLIISGTGDPAFGSDRFGTTEAQKMLTEITDAIEKAGIKKIKGNLLADESRFDFHPAPQGWIWEDLGNYFGAGVWGLNWRENKYQLRLKTGKSENDPVSILGTEPEMNIHTLVNELKTGKPNSGDNAYIFMAPYAVSGFVRGTVPPSVQPYVISGAMPDAPAQFLAELERELIKKGIEVEGEKLTALQMQLNDNQITGSGELLARFHSPKFDSLVYWFLQKSINLYGEAFVKAIAAEGKPADALKSTGATTAEGIELIRNFWESKGIQKNAIRVEDGSGLSPRNRVTPKALVTVMQYARLRPWFKAFYEGLPVVNGIHMKSGTIGGVRGYTGYVQSKTGKQYTFAIVVNNHSTTTTAITRELWKILDLLK
ncbi:MAG TPA: D-alanyl-D-alanine carboxypeptidase/D-alanyl-D-alanine-endopeptidase [Parasegetibacter sp.]